MKRLILPAFIFAALLQSCDYVEVPQQNVQPIDSNGVEKVRKVLVEDYTGHTCGYCPPAGAQLKALTDMYGEQVIPLAVHSGYFADPENSPSPYTDDFRTAVGDAYDSPTAFGISSIGNPNGMVNRLHYPNAHVKAHSTWAGYVDSLLDVPPDIDIVITNTYDNNTKQLTSSVEAEFLNAMSGTYKLVVLLSEDSIIAPQKDYTLPAPSLNPTYVHRHMLRDAVNSAWGDSIATGTTNAGTIASKSYVYNGLSTHASWNPSHCYVVAYVYNVATYEVIQAEEKKVK
jgi:hypothetical protein